VLALCLGVAWGVSAGEGNGTRQQGRGEDGGEGEYTDTCVLLGYYEFFADTTVSAGGCSTLGAQMLVHFSTRAGVCVADVVFTSWDIGFCARNIPSTPIVGSIMQQFTGTSDNGLAISFYAIALSQSQPVILLTNCCVDNTPLVGMPVEDVNVGGLHYCNNAVDWVPGSC
jgi:hypothetical protein